MKALLVIGCLMMFGCTHTVKGNLMLIKIDRTPTCKVTVQMDSKLVFEGTAKKPCPKE